MSLERDLEEIQWKFHATKKIIQRNNLKMANIFQLMLLERGSKLVSVFGNTLILFLIMSF